jgi:hypothetical protein
MEHDTCAVWLLMKIASILRSAYFKILRSELVRILENKGSLFTDVEIDQNVGACSSIVVKKTKG